MHRYKHTHSINRAWQVDKDPCTILGHLCFYPTWVILLDMISYNMNSSIHLLSSGSQGSVGAYLWELQASSSQGHTESNNHSHLLAKQACCRKNFLWCFFSHPSLGADVVQPNSGRLVQLFALWSVATQMFTNTVIVIIEVHCFPYSS